MKKHLLQLSLAAGIGLPVAALAQNTFPVNGSINVFDSAQLGAGHWTNAAEGFNYVALSTFGGSLVRGNSINVGQFTVGAWTQSAPVNGLYVAGDTQIDGNVGIGTATPQANLHVVGDNLTTGRIIASKADEAGGELRLHNPTKTGAGASNWILYNMTGIYGDSLQMWNYPASGGTYQRFRISDDGTTILTPNGGNCGIGTSNPQKKLNVSGLGFDGGGALFESLDSGNGLGIAGKDGFGIQDTAYLYFQNSADPNQTSFIGLTGQSQGSGDLRFFVNNAERLRIAKSGNVGIGTATPQSKLDVRGDLSVSGTTYSDRFLLPGGAGFGLNQGGSLELGPEVSDNAAPFIDFHHGVGRAEDFNVRLISSADQMLSLQGNYHVTGNVGIGTTGPHAKLEVVGRILAPGFSVAGSDSDQFTFTHAGATAQMPNYGLSMGPIIPNLAPTVGVAGYAGLGLFTAGENRLWVDFGGNVGIGTTTPQAKLDVEGDIRLAGRIQQSGGLSLASDGGSSTISHPNRQHIRAGERIYLLPEGDAVVIGKTLLVEGGNSQVIANKVISGTLELTSDRNQKQDFQAVSAKEIASKLASLPVTTWAYTNSPNVRHLGPMAQDFKAAFNLGEDDKHIGAGDGIGVALAAIKGLHEQVQEKEVRIAALEKKLAAQEQSFTDRLAALEQAVSKRNVQQASFRPEAAR